jgi:hypothetical protein
MLLEATARKVLSKEFSYSEGFASQSAWRFDKQNKTKQVMLSEPHAVRATLAPLQS